MKLKTTKTPKRQNIPVDVTQEYLSAVIALTADISLYLDRHVDDIQFLNVLKSDIFKKDFKKIEKLWIYRRNAPVASDKIAGNNGSG